VENQLSPIKIGLSPLTTVHRRILQHSPVRSIITWPWQDQLASGLIRVTNPVSIFIYCKNIYSIYLYNKNEAVAFARGFNLATSINLLTHYAKGTPSFISNYLVVIKFRLLIELLILITLRPTAFYHDFPLQYSFTIAKFIILSLRGWFPYISNKFSFVVLFFLLKNTYLPSL